MLTAPIPALLIINTFLQSQPYLHYSTWVTPCCPAPAVSLGTAVMILPGVPVPGVTILVVMMVMGDFIPGLLVTPAEQRDRGG